MVTWRALILTSIVLVLAMTAGGVRLDPDIYSRRPWRQRVLDYIAYALMRLALLIAGQRY